MKCENTCRALGEKTRKENLLKLEKTKEALAIRQTYIDKAHNELPGKKARMKELRTKMNDENAVLESVDLIKKGELLGCLRVLLPI